MGVFGHERCKNLARSLGVSRRIPYAHEQGIFSNLNREYQGKIRGRTERIGKCRCRPVWGCRHVRGPDGASPCPLQQRPTYIHTDGIGMVYGWQNNVQELRPKPGDFEKVTINLGYVDLGQIDLMVHEGFYSNRTDFIRTAIRNQLDRHADVVKQSVARNTLDLGLRHYTREDLETVRASRRTLHLHVLGLLSIAADVPPELARATIASLSVLGALARDPEGQDCTGGPHAVAAI